MRFCLSKFGATVTLALMTLVAPFSASIVRAQEAGSEVAVVSIAPLDSTLPDISYLLRACNVPEVGGIVSLMTTQYTQGVDQSKPIGAKVTLDGGFPNAVIFMPMNSVSQFFDALAGMGIEPEDLGDGLYEIDTGGQTIFAKESSGWMFVAQTEDALASTPANPAALLGELPKNYNIAIRVNAKNLPQEMKDMALEQIRIGFEQSLAQQPGQTEEELEAAKAMGEASMEQFEMFVEQTEQLVFGWKISQDEQRTYMDGGIRFLEGSKLAAQAEAAQDTTSKYTEFALPGSSAMFRMSSIIPEEDRALAKNNFRNSISQVESQLDQADMPEEAREMVSGLVNGLADVMEKTIDEGEFDGAGSVSVAGGKLRVLLGGKIADGNALAAEFKKAAEQIPADAPNAPKFEFDYETYQGISLHRVTVDAKIADPAAREALGDVITLIIGTGEKSYFVALDPDGDASAKQAIDGLAGASEVKVSPFEGVVSVGDFMKFAQAINPNSILDNALSTISEYAGKDKVQVNSRVISRGMLYRFSIDEGVLQTIGAAAKASSGQGGGGF